VVPQDYGRAIESTPGAQLLGFNNLKIYYRSNLRPQTWNLYSSTWSTFVGYASSAVEAPFVWETLIYHRNSLQTQFVASNYGAGDVDRVNAALNIVFAFIDPEHPDIAAAITRASRAERRSTPKYSKSDWCNVAEILTSVSTISMDPKYRRAITAFLLKLDLGCRKQDLFNLFRSEIHFDRDGVRLRFHVPKASVDGNRHGFSKYHTIPYSYDPQLCTVTLLKAYLDCYPDSQVRPDTVVIDSRGQTAAVCRLFVAYERPAYPSTLYPSLAADSIDADVSKIFKKVGVKPKGTHYLRGAFLNWAIAAGCPIESALEHVTLSRSQFEKNYLRPVPTDFSDDFFADCPSLPPSTHPVLFLRRHLASFRAALDADSDQDELTAM
jgi:integrase